MDRSSPRVTGNGARRGVNAGSPDRCATWRAADLPLAPDSGSLAPVGRALQAIKRNHFKISGYLHISARYPVHGRSAANRRDHARVRLQHTQGIHCGGMPPLVVFVALRSSVLGRVVLERCEDIVARRPVWLKEAHTGASVPLSTKCGILVTNGAFRSSHSPAQRRHKRPTNRLCDL